METIPFDFENNSDIPLPTLLWYIDFLWRINLHN